MNTSVEKGENVSEKKKIKCPKPHCRYTTDRGESLVDHLIAYHEKQAYQYLRVLLIRGDIKVEVT